MMRYKESHHDLISPWYPAVRLFRQSETREYDSVIERVRSELQAMVADRHDGEPEGLVHRLGAASPVKLTSC
jgi:hypothetical protein